MRDGRFQEFLFLIAKVSGLYHFHEAFLDFFL
jgi:hypothetical protein